MERVIEILAQAAESLGQTVQYVWPQLVGYYRWFNVAVLAQIALVAGLNVAFLPRLLKRVSSPGKERYMSDSEVAGVIWASLASIALVIFGAVAFFALPSAVGGVVFPEGKVISDLLNAALAKK